MKRISIQDLKAQLSAAVAEAQSGRTIIVTRLKPALKRGTKGRYLTVLLEDRANR